MTLQSGDVVGIDAPQVLELVAEWAVPTVEASSGLEAVAELMGRLDLGIGSDVVHRAAAALEGIGRAESTARSTAMLSMLVDGVATPQFSQPWSRSPLGAVLESGNDPGGTYQWREGGAWPAVIGDAEAQGVGLLVAALNDAGPDGPIAQDEFEIIVTDDGNYIVVLPGVIDLSKPQLGLDPTHRSSRDLDQGAARSAWSTTIDDNLYAEHVVAAMEAAGVPVGADVMLVGHSYGADTALDLAADPTFNGKTYNVTHAVAAGYHSQPQMGAVPSRTRLLALQNDKDLVVNAEREAHEVVEFGRRHVDAIVTADGPGELLSGIGGFGADLAEKAVGWVWRAPQVAREVAGDVIDSGVVTAVERQLQPEPGIFVGDEGGIRVVFDGGHEGFGHHTNNYVDYLSTDYPDIVSDFAASIGEAGYAQGGRRTFHDISVPDEE